MNRISAYSFGLMACLWLGTILGQDQVLGQVLQEVRQYKSGEEQVTVECFSPAFPGKFPGVLLLHGSGELELATGDLFREIARGLARDGYVVLIPHFFQKTGHVAGKTFEPEEIPSFLDATQDAIEFAAALDAVDPERIGVVGVSWDRTSRFTGRRASRESRRWSPSRGHCRSSHGRNFRRFWFCRGRKTRKFRQTGSRNSRPSVRPRRRRWRPIFIVRRPQFQSRHLAGREPPHGRFLREVSQAAAAKAQEDRAETKTDPGPRARLLLRRRQPFAFEAAEVGSFFRVFKRTDTK